MSPQPRSRRRTASLVAVFSAIAIALAMAVPATAAVLVGTKNIKNGAVTAKKIKNGAVNAKKIKKNAVNGKKIRKNAVKPRHVAPKTLNHIANNIATEGPQGEKGDQGDKGARGPAGFTGYELQELTVDFDGISAGAEFQRFVTCEDDKVVLGGGAAWSGSGGTDGEINGAYPRIDPTSADTGKEGLLVRATAPTGTNYQDHTLHVYLTCATKPLPTLIVP